MIINGIVNLSNSNLSSLGNLVEINGKLDLSWNYSLKDLGQLKAVNVSKSNTMGILILSNCKNLISLGNLGFVYHTLHLQNCSSLTTFGKLNFCYKIFLKGSGITQSHVLNNYPKLYNNCSWK